MELQITSHAAKRLLERNKESPTLESLLLKNGLERIASDLLRGVWYESQKKYICVARKLWVYCGVLERRRLIITTIYSFRKSKEWELSDKKRVILTEAGFVLKEEYDSMPKYKKPSPPNFEKIQLIVWNLPVEKFSSEPFYDIEDLDGEVTAKDWLKVDRREFVVFSQSARAGLSKMFPTLSVNQAQELLNDLSKRGKWYSAGEDEFKCVVKGKREYVGYFNQSLRSLMITSCEQWSGKKPEGEQYILTTKGFMPLKEFNREKKRPPKSKFVKPPKRMEFKGLEFLSEI